MLNAIEKQMKVTVEQEWVKSIWRIVFNEGSFFMYRINKPCILNVDVLYTEIMIF